MIFPPAFLDSSSCWNTNHNHLQPQQIGSNIHITTTTSPAGPGDGGGNNNNQEGLMEKRDSTMHGRSSAWLSRAFSWRLGCMHVEKPVSGLMATAGAGGGGGDGGSGGAGDGYRGGGENSKPMSMSTVPLPESGLKCARCDSTNTKFCYFNNYSLTQPRHLCRTCHRYWTHGSALRNVPVGSSYRRHAKRSAKPKAASAASGAGARTSSTTPSTTACTTDTATTPPTLQYSMFGSSPPQGWFADSFNPVSLGLSCPARLLFANGGVRHHHQENGNSMEQWAMAQMQSFPFMHSMDHQMAGQPAAAMPTTMAAIQGVFHLGLQSSDGSNGKDDSGGTYAADGGVHHHHHEGNGNGMEQWAVAQMQNFPFLHTMDRHMGEPLAAAMPTTMAAMQNMFHLGLQSGGNADDGGDHQFHHPPAKRDNQQQHQDYTSSRGIYGDIDNGNGGGSYNFYSSTSTAARN